MALTYTAIATTTVGAGGASSFDFQNIPATFTDLCILISGKTSATTSGENGTDMNVRFNNDTGSNYNSRLLYKTASGPGSSDTSGTVLYWGGQVNNSAGTMTNTFSSVFIYIPNYTSSSNKSIQVDSGAEANATTSGLYISTGIWTGTAAINRITLNTVSGSLVQYSTATLYGIKNTV